MRPRVLVLAEVYLPGCLAGGPVRSLASLVDHLGQDFDWKIITGDRDFHATDPYPGIEQGRWVELDAARVFYANPDLMSPARLAALIRETAHDLLYLNSFFSPRFSVLPMLLSRAQLIPRHPTLIAPRGEFSDGAYAIKAWKKKPYALWARLSGMYANVSWHASTTREAEDIRRVLCVPESRIHVARNLCVKTRALSTGLARSAEDALRVCFLSRIARTKNLDFALKTLSAVRGSVVFTIYGPIEDLQYWRTCEKLIAVMPRHVAVEYGGAVAADRVLETLSAHDLFFLPTRGENFGHALVEAWSAGLPVLTSDRTPWRGLEEKGVGWDLPLGAPEEFVRVIDRVSAWTIEMRRDIRARCERFGSRNVHDSDAITANREMFRKLASDVPAK